MIVQLKRISGPLLDRIDLHIEVPRVDYEKLTGDRLGESASVASRGVFWEYCPCKAALRIGKGAIGPSIRMWRGCTRSEARRRWQ